VTTAPSQPDAELRQSYRRCATPEFFGPLSDEECGIGHDPKVP